MSAHGGWTHVSEEAEGLVRAAFGVPRTLASAQKHRLFRPPAVDGHYVLYLYFPPKDGKFDGYTAEVPLEWDGKEFSLRGMCVDCDE